MQTPPLQARSSSHALPGVRTITLTQLQHWLGRGWHDMQRCGWLSYVHGLVLAVVGGALLLLAHDQFWLLAGAFSGFLLVAPALATSLYALSRALARGEEANWGVVMKTWLNWHNNHFNKWGNDYWCMVQFGTLLALAGTGWVLTSAALITLLAPAPVTSPVEFVQHVILARNGLLFELWLTLGGILAAPIFASSVVAMPLLLDRRVTLMQAVLTSWRAVLCNPLPMAIWAALIMCLTLLGLAFFLLGLVVVIPVLGHASWHAYCDLIDASTLPGRDTQDEGER